MTNIESRIDRAVNYIQSIIPISLDENQLDQITAEICGVVIYSLEKTTETFDEGDVVETLQQENFENATL